jgi:hypothetical protein
LNKRISSFTTRPAVTSFFDMRPDLTRRVTVPTHNRDLKPGTLRQIIKLSGLSVEEFNELL